MFDEFVITPVEITADETLYDWYQQESHEELCPKCGGFTYLSLGKSECYFCREEVS